MRVAFQKLDIKNPEYFKMIIFECPKITNSFGITLGIVRKLRHWIFF